MRGSNCGTALATRSFPDADIWRSWFPMAASSPTLFPEVLRSCGLIAGPQAESLLPDSGVRPLSTDHLAVANRKPAVPAKDIAVIRYPCRLCPRSAPLFIGRLPWVTGLTSYLSEMYSVYRLLTRFFEPPASRRKPAAVVMFSAACFPACTGVFAAPTLSGRFW